MFPFLGSEINYYEDTDNSLRNVYNVFKNSFKKKKELSEMELSFLVYEICIYTPLCLPQLTICFIFHLAESSQRS